MRGSYHERQGIARLVRPSNVADTKMEAAMNNLIGVNDVTLADTLESLVDAKGMTTVLETLAQIASEKADHIATNWQDTGLAKEWDRLAARLVNDGYYCQKRAYFGK